MGMTIVKPAHYGIFVGVNVYESARLAPLSFCVNDAIEMRDLLTNSRTGIIERHNTRDFHDEAATKADVLACINEYVEKLQDSDSLTITWSSHGARPESDPDELFLATYDTGVADDKSFSNSIKFVEELMPLFQTVNNFIKVILDGCHIGDALARPIIAQNENVGIMAAAKREEDAYEAELLKHGVFTYHLLQALRSPFVLQGGRIPISMEDAHAHVYRPVVDYVRSVFGRDQHPTVAGHNIHRMPLIFQCADHHMPRAR